ncbi:MAG TPA: Ig-like domain-containing protein, partial [Panacibacter sp.]|nr:Ig-like domain-containing protein [Panacibacter sp.]
MKKVYLLFFAPVFFFCRTNAQLVVFADDYGAGISFAAFGGSTNTLSIDNTQHHSGTASLKIPVTAGYTGGAFVSAAPSNLSLYNAVTFWAKNDNPAFKLDGVGLGNNAVTSVYAVERNGVTLSTTWTKYYIPIPVASKLTAETGLFHFAEGSGEGAYNIWIDDIQYENVTPLIIGTPTAAFATETITKAVGETFNPNGTVSTYAICAEGAMQTARAYFTWTSSAPAVATIDVAGSGIAVAQGTTNITGKLGTVTASGTLTVNVTAPLGDPTTAAPAPPVRNAADVISLFSDAYTNLAGTDFFPNWGQSTVVTEVLIAGNPTKKYSSLNYQGVQFASAINASAMTTLHIDVWTPNCTAFDVYPIVSGQPEQFVTLTPTLSGWNSFDIDLSKYTIPLSAVIQFKFVGTPFGSSTVYFDNLYFYKSGTAV